MATTHISQVSKNQAVDQIKMRLDRLKEWCENEIPWKMNDAGEVFRDAAGELVLDYFPTNISAFAQWTAEMNCAPVRKVILDLRPISRSTLDKDYHVETKKAIDERLKLIKQKALTQLETFNKAGQIEKLRDELKYWKQVASVQEREVKVWRQQVTAAVSAKRAEHALRLRNEKELQRELAERDRQLAEMTKAVAKVVLIKK